MTIYHTRTVFAGSRPAIDKDITIVMDSDKLTFDEYESVVDQIRGSSMYFLCNSKSTALSEADELLNELGYNISGLNDQMYRKYPGNWLHYTGD